MPAFRIRPSAGGFARAPQGAGAAVGAGLQALGGVLGDVAQRRTQAELQDIQFQQQLDRVNERTARQANQSAAIADASVLNGQMIKFEADEFARATAAKDFSKYSENVVNERIRLTTEFGQDRNQDYKDQFLRSDNIAGRQSQGRIVNDVTKGNTNIALSEFDRALELAPLTGDIEANAEVLEGIVNGNAASGLLQESWLQEQAEGRLRNHYEDLIIGNENFQESLELIKRLDNESDIFSKKEIKSLRSGVEHEFKNFEDKTFTDLAIQNNKDLSVLRDGISGNESKEKLLRFVEENGSEGASKQMQIDYVNGWFRTEKTTRPTTRQLDNDAALGVRLNELVELAKAATSPREAAKLQNDAQKLISQAIKAGPTVYTSEFLDKNQNKIAALDSLTLDAASKEGRGFFNRKIGRKVSVQTNDLVRQIEIDPEGTAYGNMPFSDRIDLVQDLEARARDHIAENGDEVDSSVEMSQLLDKWQREWVLERVNGNEEAAQAAMNRQQVAPPPTGAARVQTVAAVNNARLAGMSDEDAVDTLVASGMAQEDAEAVVATPAPVAAAEEPAAPEPVARETAPPPQIPAPQTPEERAEFRQRREEVTGVPDIELVRERTSNVINAFVQEALFSDVPIPPPEEVGDRLVEALTDAGVVVDKGIRAAINQIAKGIDKLQEPLQPTIIRPENR